MPHQPNRLINETSPYLLQHAHNPVDWYPWGAEAFQKAKAENKPILLSIGYSACHWCHVMERESFENEEIAQRMNELFVNIKVDREERPDVDQIYMNAVQMMTHHGGWPMTVFLTPDGVPYYGGTYFPPEDRYNMPGFPRVLESVALAYNQRPTDIADTSSSILRELKRLGSAAESKEILNEEILDAAYAGMVRNFDRTHGGFGGAPKFPPAMTLEFLLRTYHRTRRENSLEVVTLSLEKMAAGGIYDHLGGGFHRYSTDAKWLVPHFEKMLYDNALLARIYLHYYQVTKDQSAKAIVEGILDYVVREMTDEKGGFYSTQDADSEGHEGKFFVWSLEEITEALGAEDAKLFNAYYNITAEGNFEGKNILNVTRSVADVAAEAGISEAQLHKTLMAARTKLMALREQRIKPGRDEKVLTAWNGLMLASFAESAAVLERKDYAAVARKNAAFVLENLRRDGLLLRSFKDGQAKLNAYLEDYAFLADGLLLLFEATGEIVWLDEAKAIAAQMIAEFWDEDEGGFFFTGKSHEQLIVRSKDYFDNATPSGNSVAADVLLRLAVMLDDDDFRRHAVTVLRLVVDTAKRFPSGFGRALSALDFYLSTPKEIVVLGEESSPATQGLLREVWTRYLPNKVLAWSQAPLDSQSERLLPLFQGRSLKNGAPTAFVCERYTCQTPVNSASDLSAQLK